MRGADLVKILHADVMNSQEISTPVRIDLDLARLPALELLEVARAGLKFMADNDGPTSSTFALKAVNDFYQVLCSVDSKRSYFLLKDSEIATRRVLALSTGNKSMQEALGIREMGLSEVPQAREVQAALSEVAINLQSAIQSIRLGMIPEIGTDEGNQAADCFGAAIRSAITAAECYRGNQRG